MPRRALVLIAAALLGSALFIRLGIWQLERLAARRAVNARVAERLHAEPVPVAALPRDTALARYRRVVVSGVLDTARELVVTGKTRQGSPGVHLVTPVRVPGSDTAVLVVRGWVYSPDGATVDLARWRDGDSARFVGYVQSFPPARPGAVEATSRPNTVRRLDASWLAERYPYPLAPYYVMSITGTTPTGEGFPARFELPALDEGSHRGYAIQWFSFAVIAVVGTIILLRAEPRTRGRGPG